MKYTSTIIPSVVLLGLLASCGNKDEKKKESISDTGNQTEEEAENTNGVAVAGTYNAKFETLNPQINGTIPGSTTVMLKEEKIYFYLRLFAGGAQTWHPQNIYTGSRCPTAVDDENGDGIIDIIEGNKVWGDILIPLDANVNSQDSGRNFYPLSDLSGSYHYERITNFEGLLRDLKAPDKNPSDNVVKLAPDQELDFENKVVVVQGVLPTTELPETVQSYGRFTPVQTLPIACAVFKKVHTMPGELDTELIPGPVAQVIEGQDRPAQPGEGETPGTPTTPTGGTNESDRGETPTSSGGTRNTETGSNENERTETETETSNTSTSSNESSSDYGSEDD